MTDEHKTKQELINELAELRHRVATLEKPGDSRKPADKARGEDEEVYRALVERAKGGICIIQNGKLVYVNPYLAEMVGYTVEDLVNTPFTEYIYPDELSKVLDYYRRRMAGEDVPQNYESVLKHRGYPAPH